jgi:hypothetical protein
MLSLSFSFDGDCPPEVKEDYALYLIDGPLQIQDGTRVFVATESVPLIELALWLAEWLTSTSTLPPAERVFSFFPDSFVAELFQLAPVGDSRYQLTYLAYEQGDTTRYLTADYADFQQAFTHFIHDLTVALQQQYTISLDNILQRHSASRRRRV